MRRKRSAEVGFLVFILLASYFGNALTFYVFDRGVDPDRTVTLADAFWYSLISITTVGYGDFFAISLGARIGTAIFIVLLGLTAFTAAVGIGIDWIMDLRDKERTGMGSPGSKNHLLIVNYPNERRIRRIIDEFVHDPIYKNEEIVLVTDQIDSFPLALRNVYFVRGSPLEEETYIRANVREARQAIVLSTGYDDPNTDSVVASIASVLEHLNPDLRIVAECLDMSHTLLFQGTRNVSLVYTFTISNNLLVQEVQDPGVNLLTQAITSNQIEGTLLSTQVGDGVEASMSYRDVAKKLLDCDVNLVGVIRDGDVLVQFDNLALAKDDRLVYIAAARLEWQSIYSFLSS